MTDEDEQRALRRLLQHLEQSIGARPVELVDGVDDRDPPAALPGGRTEKRYGAAHVVDGNLLPQDALVVEGALQHEEITLRLSGDPARHRVLCVNGK